MRFTIEPHTIHIQARCNPNKKLMPIAYKMIDEELDTMVQDWPTYSREPVCTKEVLMGTPTYSPKEHMCKEHSHHDSDGVSLKDIDPKAQRILEERNTKRRMEQDTGGSTRLVMEAQLQ